MNPQQPPDLRLPTVSNPQVLANPLHRALLEFLAAHGIDPAGITLDALNQLIAIASGQSNNSEWPNTDGYAAGPGRLPAAKSSEDPAPPAYGQLTAAKFVESRARQGAAAEIAHARFMENPAYRRRHALRSTALGRRVLAAEDAKVKGEQAVIGAFAEAVAAKLKARGI